MIHTSLKNRSLIFIYIGFLTLILLPLYGVFYLFYLYYLFVSMPYFLVLMPVIAIILYVLYIVWFIAETKIVLKFFDHSTKEGKFDLKELKPAVFLFTINDIFNRMVESLFDKLLIPKTIISDVLFDLYGYKKGKKVHIGSPIFDPYLVELGDNVVVGKHALVLGHFIVGDKIYLKRTKVGKNVTIGSYSIISPGVIIEDNVIVGANSFVKQDSVLKSNSLYAGTPAKFIKKLD